MSPVAALDAWIIAADAALALQLQTTPLVVLIAVGALMIGTALIAAGAACRAASMVQYLVGLNARGIGIRRRGADDELLLPLVSQRLRPGGAQGARAPGRPVPRPAPLS